MGFLGKWQTTALAETCKIETGSAATSPVNQIDNVACMEVPPTEFEDDTTLKLLVEDADAYGWAPNQFRSRPVAGSVYGQPIHPVQVE